MLKLDKKHKAAVEKILSLYIPGHTVWVYGSRIKGTSHDGSDLDLVIMPTKNQPLTAEKLAALRSAFSDSNLPMLVDILNWDDIPEEFKTEIEKCHEVFFG